MKDRALRFYATELLNPVDAYRLKRERERERGGGKRERKEGRKKLYFDKGIDM